MTDIRGEPCPNCGGRLIVIREKECTGVISIKVYCLGKLHKCSECEEVHFKSCGFKTKKVLEKYEESK
jgi:hypothetical protein